MKTIDMAACEYVSSKYNFSDNEISIEIRNSMCKDFVEGANFVNKWYSFKDHRPPYYITCLVKVHEKTEPIAAWLASTGDSDIWTICSTDIILPPVKLWRPIF